MNLLIEVFKNHNSQLITQIVSFLLQIINLRYLSIILKELTQFFSVFNQTCCLFVLLLNTEPAQLFNTSYKHNHLLHRSYSERDVFLRKVQTAYLRAYGLYHLLAHLSFHLHTLYLIN